MLNSVKAWVSGWLQPTEAANGAYVQQQQGTTCDWDRDWSLCDVMGASDGNFGRFLESHAGASVLAPPRDYLPRPQHNGQIPSTSPAPATPSAALVGLSHRGDAIGNPETATRPRSVLVSAKKRRERDSDGHEGLQGSRAAFGSPMHDQNHASPESRGGVQQRRLRYGDEDDVTFYQPAGKRQAVAEHAAGSENQPAPLPWWWGKSDGTAATSSNAAAMATAAAASMQTSTAAPQGSRPGTAATAAAARENGAPGSTLLALPAPDKSSAPGAPSSQDRAQWQRAVRLTTALRPLRPVLKRYA